MTATTTERPPGLLKRFGLEIDSLALTFASGVTAVLGMAYWAAAARGYAVVEVGRASAVISSATMLAALANLSLGGMYERFLGGTGRETHRALAAGAAVTASFATVLGLAFLLLGPSDRLFDHGWEMATFPLLVVVLANFALLDNVLVGLHRARWAALKNTLHSVAKLALAAGLAFLASGFSLVLAWIGPALVLCLSAAPLIWRRWTVGPAYDLPPDLPPRRELWSYFGSNYGIMVVGALPPLLIPLLVLHRLGAEMNAYFTVSWTLFSALGVLLSTVIGPYIAQACLPGAPVYRLTLRFASILAAIAIAGAVFLWFMAPWLLGLLGKSYGAESEGLVRLMGLTLPLTVVGSLYAGLARVVRRLRLAVVLQIVCSCVLVSGSWWALGRWGLDGIGYTYLAVEVLVTVVLIGPMLRILWSFRPAVVDV